MFRKIVSLPSKSKSRKFLLKSLHSTNNYCYCAPSSLPSKEVNSRRNSFEIIIPASLKGFNRSFSSGLHRNKRFADLGRRGFSSETETGHRESIDYDVVIVGGGPAGLSAAIRLKRLLLVD